jgi:NADH-quinone oxidoreductase subunit H
MSGTDFLITLATVVAAFALWLISTAVFIWGERRIVSKMQSRIGPNRLGPFGMLQTLADGIKMFFKEDIEPENVDRPVYYIAPAVSAIVAFLTFAVVPFGGTFTVGEREIALQVWDPEIGMLWVLAMSSLGVYGIALGGWSSGSKYPLLGGVRSTAQMVSYELALGLGMAAVFVWNGTLQSSQIVEAQRQVLQFGPVSLPAWNIVPQLPAFALFFLAAVAEAQRPPFDLPEGEGELVGGFNTEYSGAKFAMFFLAEFMAVITMSAVTVTLFFGGPSGPLRVWLPGAGMRDLEGTIWGALLGVLYFAIKVFVFMFVFVWLRGTLPRLKYDRLMDLGWKVLLPVGLVWVLATATIVVAQENLARAQLQRYVLIAAGVVVAIALLTSVFDRRPRQAPETGEEHADDGDGAAEPEPVPEQSAESARIEQVRRAVDERTPERVTVRSSRP